MWGCPCVVHVPMCYVASVKTSASEGHSGGAEVYFKKGMVTILRILVMVTVLDMVTLIYGC